MHGRTHIFLDYKKLKGYIKDDLEVQTFVNVPPFSAKGGRQRNKSRLELHAYRFKKDEKYGITRKQAAVLCVCSDLRPPRRPRFLLAKRMIVTHISH